MPIRRAYESTTPNAPKLKPSTPACMEPTTAIAPAQNNTDAFRNFRMGYACATSWIMFALMLVMTLVLFATSKKWVYYDN